MPTRISGSAYTMIITDTLARYYRASGWDTFYLTGTDEHGDKIAQAAADAGAGAERVYRSGQRVCFAPLGTRAVLPTIISSAQLTTTICAMCRNFCRKFTMPATSISTAMADFIVSAANDFIPKRICVDGKCPDHLTAPKLIEEENYFFRMSKYQERLLEHIEDNPDFIRPEGFKNEVLGMLARTDRRSVHLSSEKPADLGDRAALRSNAMSPMSGSTR